MLSPCWEANLIYDDGTGKVNVYLEDNNDLVFDALPTFRFSKTLIINLRKKLERFVENSSSKIVVKSNFNQETFDAGKLAELEDLIDQVNPHLMTEQTFHICNRIVQLFMLGISKSKNVELVGRIVIGKSADSTALYNLKPISMQYSNSWNSEGSATLTQNILSFKPIYCNNFASADRVSETWNILNKLKTMKK
jgi:hypothetical protein